ncbi:MAG TPA: DUF6134 family protein [Rhizomicrobium sp.]|jgi:hypothetical protein
MLTIRTAIGALAASAALVTLPALAGPDSTTVKFLVTRNGSAIGTNQIRVGHDGDGTTVEMVTHVKVGFAFVTFYKFDQTETEHWSDGRLLALNSITDDNGTVRRANATARDGMLVVECDGKTNRTPATTIPFNLWNSELVARNVALDTRNGGLEQLKVTDRGEENVVVQGQTRRAHRYEIVTSFPEDVWYDDSGELVQVEMKAMDGSTIRYQLA